MRLPGLCSAAAEHEYAAALDVLLLHGERTSALYKLDEQKLDTGVVSTEAAEGVPEREKVKQRGSKSTGEH